MKNLTVKVTKECKESAKGFRNSYAIPFALDTSLQFARLGLYALSS